MLILQETAISILSGFCSAIEFMIMDFLSPVAEIMHYWRTGNNNQSDNLTPRSTHNVHLRKLSIEQEILLCMMRLRLGLLVDDLAFRFKISSSLTSCIFTTWIETP